MLPESLQDLEKLAYNLWWSWQPDGHALWEAVDDHRWERCHHNPVALLKDVEPERFAALAADAAFLARLADLSDRFDAWLAAPTWYAERFPTPTRVAYFSMEFGLHDSLRTYSGGLGVLAGDHLRSATDLGVPLVGVTLFYHQGYFRQVIDDGRQLAVYPAARTDRLPLRLCADAKGNAVTVTVHVGDHDVRLRAWSLGVGRNQLLLLDSDWEVNSEAARALTRQLYGGDDRMRIQQEVLLGIGGVRMVRALRLDPHVWHMNEGHCAFLPLELLREHTDAGLTWEQAMADVQSRCVFTTHTPVPAGHDRFHPDLVTMALGPFREAAGWPKGTILDLGRVHPGDVNETLCMTVLALKTSHSTNGVSRKHGEVSRDMWRCLWPDRPVDQVPIGHITNGVHPTFWMAPPAQELFDRHVAGWRDRPWDEDHWRAGVARIPDAELWATRAALRRRMTELLARRAGIRLDPDALTLGFARRFATYKRGDLLFANPDRLAALFDALGPVQLVYAGKAHPRDHAGQAVLARILQWANDPRFRGRVHFVEDYDIAVGAALTSGVDVWVNNPRRPLEASGTSGQKATLNLGLNLSILDGWWMEAWDGSNGFSIGQTHVADDARMDVEDGAALYDTLEREVLPAWTTRDLAGLPTGWLDRVRRSTVTCASLFNSHRMVRDYVVAMYRVVDRAPPPVARPTRA